MSRLGKGDLEFYSMDEEQAFCCSVLPPIFDTSRFCLSDISQKPKPKAALEKKQAGTRRKTVIPGMFIPVMVHKTCGVNVVCFFLLCSVSLYFSTLDSDEDDEPAVEV